MLFYSRTPRHCHRCPQIVSASVLRLLWIMTAWASNMGRTPRALPSSMGKCGYLRMPQLPGSAGGGISPLAIHSPSLTSWSNAQYLIWALKLCIPWPSQLPPSPLQLSQRSVPSLAVFNMFPPPPTYIKSHSPLRCHMPSLYAGQGDLSPPHQPRGSPFTLDRTRNRSHSGGCQAQGATSGTH